MALQIPTFRIATKGRVIGRASAGMYPVKVAGAQDTAIRCDGPASAQVGWL